LTRSADTYVVQRGITKGTGVAAVREYVGCREAPVAAMGDSDEDVPMLEAAASWYAPANCSARVRKLAQGAGAGGRITARPRQQGFLEAVRDVLRKRGVRPRDLPAMCGPACVRTPANLLMTLLRVSERSLASRVLAGLAWRRL